MLTKDEVPVLMHDAAFGRTIAGRGQVARTNASDLVAMDAGAWFDAAFDGEAVPTLEQALEYCKQHQVFMNIEIKPAPQFDRRTGELVALAARDFQARRAGLEPMILLSSFSAVALAAARDAAPEIPRGYLLHRLKGDWVGQLAALGCLALHCNHELVDAGLMSQMRDLDTGVFCYTVNSRKARRRTQSAGGGRHLHRPDRSDRCGFF